MDETLYTKVLNNRRHYNTPVGYGNQLCGQGSDCAIKSMPPRTALGSARWLISLAKLIFLALYDSLHLTIDIPVAQFSNSEP